MGLFPVLGMAHWSSYYDALALSTTGRVVILSFVISAQAVIFTLLDQPLEAWVRAISIRQSDLVRRCLLKKVPNRFEYLADQDNVNQKLMEINTFFDSINSMLKNVCIAFISIVANFTYLYNLGCFSLGLKIFSLILLTDFIAAYASTSNESWSLSSRKKGLDNAKNELRDASDLLKDNSVLLNGMYSLQKSHLMYLQHKNEESLKLVYYQHFFLSKVIDVFTTCCQKIVEPLLVLSFILSGSLQLPLVSSTSKNQITTGTFKQLLYCFVQFWRNGSIFKNNNGHFSKIDSSYKNATPLHYSLNFHPYDIIANNDNLSIPFLFLCNICLSLWWYTLVSFISTYLVNNHITSIFTVPFAPPALLGFLAFNAFFIFFSNHRKHHLTSYFEISLSLCILSMFSTSTMLFVFLRFIPSLNSVYIFRSTLLVANIIAQVLCTACYANYERSLSKHFLKINDDSGRPRMHSRSDQSIVVKHHNKASVYPIFNKTNKNLSSQSFCKSSISNGIVLKNLSLITSIDKKPLKIVCRLSENNHIELQGMCLITGSESSGKSALVMRALSQNMSGHGNSWLYGEVMLQDDLLLVFDQNNNSMQNLDRYNRDFYFYKDGNLLPKMCDLQKIFYSLAFSNPYNLTDQDQQLYSFWPRIKNDMLTFLAKEELNFIEAWRNKIDQDGVIPPLSGGNKAKIMSAIMYALLNIPNLQPGRKISIAVDVAFEGISEAVQPHILRLFKERVSLSKYTNFIAVLTTNLVTMPDDSICDLSTFFDSEHNFVKRVSTLVDEPDVVSINKRLIQSL
ncbi:MAG: hypothetical protein VX112_05135 [Pseudomonadota bacterium]|nr:hypothetical protein [Pseudomonadota bacterium]